MAIRTTATKTITTGSLFVGCHGGEQSYLHGSELQTRVPHKAIAKYIEHTEAR